MAEGLDPTPASTASDGRHKIAFVPYGADVNPLSVATLGKPTTKNVTYSYTSDGFAHAITQATVEDKRYTLSQDLSRGGKTTETLEVKYVDSEDPSSAAVIHPRDTAGWFVRRKALDNATDWAADQVVDVITVIAGVQRPDAPTENGVDTITQGMYITAPTQTKVKLVE
ncbi:hypothetical protein [Curtobacterium sp. MCBD17_003]|uniref:phage tail tube protein n=1 Tax=Curtobacterium sp. MCBD17_003 TaxID=2175667 RepID=UPI000DA94CDC|nr:hypothetical protein [Curtobacterium sp. MCBD17_003]WIE54228.1 hypothetical protein DEI88_014055 [Curtobacterium sp. MCBD17_003]